jgi:hypothetical protein
VPSAAAFFDRPKWPQVPESGRRLPEVAAGFQPAPPVAQFTDFRHVYIGVPRQEFNDVGARLHAPRVELERDEMRERNDSQAASGTDDGVGCGQSALDDHRPHAARFEDRGDFLGSVNDVV